MTLIPVNFLERHADYDGGQQYQQGQGGVLFA